MNKSVVFRIVTVSAAIVVAYFGVPVAIGQDSGDGPKSMIVFDSTVGEVTFPHEAHFDDLEIECEACHHETNAKMLHMPHEEYFKDFWIECGICHHPSNEPQEAKSCATCHHCPVNCSDETMSTKVVIHQNCWQCHESGEGEDASATCAFCHTGPKQEW